MCNSMMLSIVVPVYNAELYLEKCLDSLLTQDVCNNEFEVICVNDGSTDKSVDILDKYSSRYNNLVVIHKDNGGVSSARNCGIDEAKGEYIWFIDSDDFIKENSLTKIISFLRENDYDRVQIYPYAFKGNEADFDPDEITVSMSQSAYKNFLWTQILKRDMIVDNKVYFDTEISYAEDAIFMIQIIHLIKKSIRFEDVIYFYRLRESSLMSQNTTRKIKSRIKGVIDCNEICEGKRFGDVEAARWFKYQSTAMIMRDISRLSKEERKKYVGIVKSLGLFPLKYNSKFTPESDGKDLSCVNRIKLFLSNRAYTGYGYRLLLIYLFILKCCRRIKHIFVSKD